MCGIVGLLIKKPPLRSSLGEFVTPMLVCMGERGADSAGLAVFSEPSIPPLRRFSLFAPQPGFEWKQLGENLTRSTDSHTTIEATGNHATLTSSFAPDDLKSWLQQNYPVLHLLSVGRSIDVYKDTGHPCELERRYRFSQMKGSHAVGHTRMATESAVSPAHSHPFTAGEDFCLVHNGSLSNPHSVRRRLEKKGIRFETDNDTEAACRFLEWRMSEGDSLEQAITRGFEELDGFFTLLIATAQKLTLVRDPFACKPAVVAETDDYVAISSEFRSLAHLPQIKTAQIFEPVPETIYSWSVNESTAPVENPPVRGEVRPAPMSRSQAPRDDNQPAGSSMAPSAGGPR